MPRLLTILAVVTFTACATAPAPVVSTLPGPTSIQGDVRMNGSPVPGVTVAVRNTRRVTFTTVTDAQGHFIIPSVKPGEYVITATQFGLEPVRHTVDVVPDSITVVELVMKAGSLAGLKLVEPFNISIDRMAGAT